MKMNIIDGREYDWKGKIITSQVTEKSLNLVGSQTITEGFLTTDEKIVGTNNLRSVAILEKMLQISRSVVHITVPGLGLGTGFMISPDVLMTNNHIFPSKQDAKEAIIRFNYQVDLSGNALPTDDYECDISSFHTNDPLDYSIVKVKDSPGFKWGYIQLSSDEAVKIQEDVFIIQHPNGGQKQIALSDNVVAYVDDTVVQYLTDTLPGSSGAPVLNDAMRVIALHHSGG